MAKTNGGFNLSKTTKKLACGIVNKNQRRKFLNLMVEAEAAYNLGRNRKFSDPAVAQKGRETHKE